MNFHNRSIYRLLSFSWHLILCVILLSNTGCKKFIEGVGLPRTEIGGDAVYANDMTATAVVTGIYSRMLTDAGFASGSFMSVTFLAGMSADELTNYGTHESRREFYENALNSMNGFVTTGLWNQMYQYIYSANSLLEGLERSEGITPVTKKRLLGEARFIRAFCYFYLVNLFGEVPLLTATDYRANAIASRTAIDLVYKQIIDDLNAAKSSMSDDYDNAERARPNKWAATALLARVYLYRQEWVNAEAQATAVINHTATYQLLDSLNNIFLGNSREAIWQLKPANPRMNTWEAVLFILTRAPHPTDIYQSAAISNYLLAAFAPGDRRKSSWVDSVQDAGKIYYFPYKYKTTATVVTEYSMVLRLAEQYLIRSEAAAQQNKFAQARADLNVIRKRAGLARITANTQAGLLRAIEQERQIELFTEWGHRWLDLKRTGRADAVLGIRKPNWQPFDALYPIPLNDVQRNPEMTQNPGYQ